MDCFNKLLRIIWLRQGKLRKYIQVLKINSHMLLLKSVHITKTDSYLSRRWRGQAHGLNSPTE